MRFMNPDDGSFQPTRVHQVCNSLNLFGGSPIDGGHYLYLSQCFHIIFQSVHFCVAYGGKSATI